MSRANSERVKQQLTGHDRAELGHPLVDVHASVKATRLLHRWLVLARRRQPVEGLGGRREEAVGVEVAASNLVGLNDRIGRLVPDTQRQPRVPELIWGESVDHRPLVQPKAPELRGVLERRREQLLNVIDGLRALREEGGDIHDRGARRVGGVVAPRSTIHRIGERDPRPRMPLAQLRGLKRVVGEQEVLDRVLLPTMPALTVGGGEGVRALLVRGL